LHFHFVQPVVTKFLWDFFDSSVSPIVFGEIFFDD
jgi:hypothetical protein